MDFSEKTPFPKDPLFRSSTSPFSHARNNGFSFLSCGSTPSRTVPKTQPLQVAFSLLERVDLRSQKEGILGKNVAWEGWGGRAQKKGKNGRAKEKKGGEL